MPDAPIRVLLVDDHAMVRRGMRDFLDLHDDIEVVGEAADGSEAVERADELVLDIVVMDLMMPNLDGIEAIARIKATHPELEVIALTSFIEEEKVTIAGGVPTVFMDVLRHADENDVDFSTLRKVTCGGSAVPLSLMQAFEERHGVYIEQAWGMTEMSPLGTIARPPAGTEDEDRKWDYRSSAGRVNPLVEARIVDDDGAEVDWDGEETGELEKMLGKIADFYEDEVDSSIATLTSILEPLMMIGVGMMVGVIIISMYLPMFKLLTLIQ